MSYFDRLTTPVTKEKALAHQAITTPVNGTSISLAGVVALNFTVLCTAYTSGTMTAKIEVSTDNSNWTALNTKYVTGSISITAVDQCQSIGINGLDSESYTHIRLATVGTVVLSAVGICEKIKIDR
jgi:hypothetical protein